MTKLQAGQPVRFLGADWEIDRVSETEIVLRLREDLGSGKPFGEMQIEPSAEDLPSASGRWAGICKVLNRGTIDLCLIAGARECEMLAALSVEPHRAAAYRDLAKMIRAGEVPE